MTGVAAPDVGRLYDYLHDMKFSEAPALLQGTARLPGIDRGIYKDVFQPALNDSASRWAMLVGMIGGGDLVGRQEFDEITVGTGLEYRDGMTREEAVFSTRAARAYALRDIYMRKGLPRHVAEFGAAMAAGLTEPSSVAATVFSLVTLGAGLPALAAAGAGRNMLIAAEILGSSALATGIDYSLINYQGKQYTSADALVAFSVGAVLPVALKAAGRAGRAALAKLDEMGTAAKQAVRQIPAEDAAAAAASAQHGFDISPDEVRRLVDTTAFGNAELRRAFQGLQAEARDIVASMDAELGRAGREATKQAALANQAAVRAQQGDIGDVAARYSRALRESAELFRITESGQVGYAIPFESLFDQNLFRDDFIPPFLRSRKSPSRQSRFDFSTSAEQASDVVAEGLQQLELPFASTPRTQVNADLVREAMRSAIRSGKRTTSDEAMDALAKHVHAQEWAPLTLKEIQEALNATLRNKDLVDAARDPLGAFQRRIESLVTDKVRDYYSRAIVRELASTPAADRVSVDAILRRYNLQPSGVGGPTARVDLDVTQAEVRQIIERFREIEARSEELGVDVDKAVLREIRELEKASADIDSLVLNCMGLG